MSDPIFSSPLSGRWLLGFLFFFTVMALSSRLLVFTGESHYSALVNLKQVLTGSLIYTAEYDDLFPHYGHWETERPASGPWIKGDQRAWRKSLDPYLKNDLLFVHPEWPYSDRSGQSTELVRGAVNGGSCFGYVEEIQPRWFGTEDGHLRLNPTSPPPDFVDQLELAESEAPLLEDLAWREKGWFGRSEERRITDSTKRGYRMVGRMDASVRLVPTSP